MHDIATQESVVDFMVSNGDLGGNLEAGHGLETKPNVVGWGWPDLDQQSAFEGDKLDGHQEGDLFHHIVRSNFKALIGWIHTEEEVTCIISSPDMWWTSLKQTKPSY